MRLHLNGLTGPDTGVPDEGVLKHVETLNDKTATLPIDLSSYYRVVHLRTV